MWTPAVVEVEIAADRSASFADAVVGSQIHLLVFDAAPEPVQPPGPSRNNDNRVDALPAERIRPPATAVVRVPSAALLVAKRSLDIVGAAFGLLFFASLLLALAIVVKVTLRGPVLFCQDRYGQRNKRFRIYKFRSMYAHLNDHSGVRQPTSGDPRITPVGRLMRRTNLDELPQLFNVLEGDMSLVGPRPHVPRMRAAGVRYEELVPYYFTRHSMRPGLTGLAQGNGLRGSTVVADRAISRIDYDLEYVESWSLWLDVRIIVATIVQELVRGTGE